jgi:hypothetical protein
VVEKVEKVEMVAAGVRRGRGRGACSFLLSCIIFYVLFRYVGWMVDYGVGGCMVMLMLICQSLVSTSPSPTHGGLRQSS